MTEPTEIAPLIELLREAREALTAVKQHEDSAFWGPDHEKNKNASWKGVRRKARAALAKIDKALG